MDLSSLNLQTVGALASIAGLLPTLAQWFTSEYRARKTKKKADAKEIIDQYIEWLRRQRHDELITKLSGSQQALSELHNLVNQLLTTSKEERKQVLSGEQGRSGVAGGGVAVGWAEGFSAVCGAKGRTGGA